MLAWRQEYNELTTTQRVSLLTFANTRPLRRDLLKQLFGKGGETAWMQPPWLPRGASSRHASKERRLSVYPPSLPQRHPVSEIRSIRIVPRPARCIGRWRQSLDLDAILTRDYR